MTRLYTNENFPQQVVDELRRLGHEVLTSQEAGNAGQSIPDDEVLNFARVNNRAVLTLNRRHFIRLHQNNRHTRVLSFVRSIQILPVWPFELIRHFDHTQSFRANSSALTGQRQPTELIAFRLFPFSYQLFFYLFCFYQVQSLLKRRRVGSTSNRPRRNTPGRKQFPETSGLRP